MQPTKILKSSLLILLVFLLAAPPLALARPCLPELPAPASVQSEDDDSEGVSFENLLPAGCYSLYIEARNIGAVLQSTEVRETFEPIGPMLDLMSGGSMELQWIRMIVDNADKLQKSRVMIALSPKDTSQPEMLLAVELESEDAAQEFQIQLETKLGAIRKLAADAARAKDDGSIAPNKILSPLPGLVRRAGRLVAMSIRPFTFRQLHANTDKLATDDLNFRLAHDRFYAEPLFIYYDISLSRRASSERAAASSQDGNSPDSIRPSPAITPTASEGIIDTAPGESAGKPVIAVDSASRGPASKQAARSTRVTPPPPPPSSPRAGAVHVSPPPPVGVTGDRSAAQLDMVGSFFKLLISDGGQAPDGLAVALALENESLVARALLIGAPGAPAGPLPFISLPVSGPAISSEAANYVPAETEIFATVSVDWNRLYEAAVGGSGHSSRALQGYNIQVPNQPVKSEADSREAAFEKAYGVRLADLLTATLGNEIALSVPASYITGTPLGRLPLKSQTAPLLPLMLVAVRDRATLIPKLNAVFEVLGFKQPTEKAKTEKVGDVEIVNYAGFSYAFVNQYLVLAANPDGIHRVIRAHGSETSLGANHQVQTYTHWQPGATIAQLYVSPELLKGLLRDLSKSNQITDEAAKEFLARYRFDPEPITYAASAEATGAAYELRIPRRLLMRLFAELAAGEMASRIPRNEAIARSIMQALGEQERTYKKQHGRYASLDELESPQMFKESVERFGYKLQINVSDSDYQVTATPTEYGKTGRLSFYLDQSGKIREGDHAGKPASSSDKPAGSEHEN